MCVFFFCVFFFFFFFFCFFFFCFFFFVFFFGFCFTCKFEFYLQLKLPSQNICRFNLIEAKIFSFKAAME